MSIEPTDKVGSPTGVRIPSLSDTLLSPPAAGEKGGFLGTPQTPAGVVPLHPPKLSGTSVASSNGKSGTPVAHSNGKSATSTASSNGKSGTPVAHSNGKSATSTVSSNGKSANPVAHSNGKSATSTVSSNGKSANPIASNNGNPTNPAADAGYGNEAPGIGGIPYKWLVVMAVVFGVFASILDTTAVNVALPKLQAVFGATLDQIQGVVTYYLLALAVTVPLAGYLADRFGIKRVYMTALVIFTGASMLCGISSSTGSLIFFRVVQGLGGGALLPLAIAMIYSVFSPQERGLASAAIGIPILFAPALGPTLSGYIVQYSDWRLIFFLNVPIGIAGFLMAFFLLRERRSPNPGRFDLPGFMLSTLGFSTLLYGVTKVPSDGWTSLTVLSFIGFGSVSLLFFVYVELTSESPLLDLRLFKDWSFLSGNLISWVLQISLFGTLFLLSLFLQNLRGLSPFETGLWLMPEALVTIVMLPVAGILVDRFGPKWNILVGSIALALASFGLAHLGLYVSFWGLQSVLVIRSVALAFSLQPASQVALYNVSRQALARASSLQRVLAQVAASFGTAVMATYLQNRLPVHFAHLAEQATTFSPAANFVARIAQGLVVHGYSPFVAHEAALRILEGRIQQQASVLAFNDTYLLGAAIATLGVFIALFLRGGNPKKAAKGSSQGSSSKEEIEARKAALAEALV